MAPAAFGCCFYALSSLAVVMVSVPFIAQHIADLSPLNVYGNVNDIVSLDTGGIQADFNLTWELDVPYWGRQTSNLDEKLKLSSEPFLKENRISVKNPTWSPIQLFAETVSFKGPISDGRKEFAEYYWRDSLVFQPGQNEERFQTWIRVTDVPQASHYMADILRNGDGEDITVEFSPSWRMFGFAYWWINVGKTCRCRLQPLPGPFEIVLTAEKVSSRTSLLSRQRSLAVSQWRPNTNNVWKHLKVNCTYLGNAWTVTKV